MNRDRIRALIKIAVTAIALSIAVGGYIMGDKTVAGAGVERTTGNRLGGEASLYLRQHAQNPVHWQPWDEAALARSRELDRPIFLSIGYASCHWCHVMEEEVFTDAAAAAYLNEHFISIKVDREERPDLDAVYMEAVQAMTGSGGWPLTVFLTPDLKPFFGGTYFPRDTFLELIRRVASVYENRRDELEQSAETLTSRLGRNPLGKSGDLPGAENVGGAVAAALERVDNRWGGFSGRQKFPTPPRWRLMLHQYRKTGQKPIADALRLTLDRMADGGIRDQIGGGFHRYSVEPTWLVPHFEIMLYDNVQLASLYLEAAAVFADDRYRRVATGVLDFLLREMANEEGGFYASFDADSGGEEGSYYVWTPAQIVDVAGETDGPPLADLLGVTAEGNFEGRSIPTRRMPPAAVAARHGGDADSVTALAERWLEELRLRRSLRTAPALDRKIVTSWNGMALSAFAAGYSLTGDDRYREAAAKAADFLWRSHRGDDGRLVRTSTDGLAGAQGILDDYGSTACGLIDLYTATGEVRQLRRALELIESARGLFRGAGGAWHLTAEDAEAPLGRRIDLFDSVEPSGASAMIHAQLKAAALTGRTELRDEAGESLAAAADMIAKADLEMACWLDAALLLSGPFYEVVLAGDPADPSLAELVRIYDRMLPPHAVLSRTAAGGPDSEQLALMPPLAGKTAPNGRSAAYVCLHGACLAPATSAADFARKLGAGWAY